jgi:hypothetical protein
MDCKLEVTEGPERLQAAVSGTRMPEAALAVAQHVMAVCAGRRAGRVLVHVRELAGRPETSDACDLAAVGFSGLDRRDVLRRAAIVDRGDDRLSPGSSESSAQNRGSNLRVFDD